MENALLAPLEARDFEALRELRRLLVVEAKELGAYVAAARWFVKAALDRADRLADSDPEQSRELLSLAKRASYNLGADTWPGWGDGPAVEPMQQQLGAAAAALCLELGDRLREDDDRRANAHWLVGAHALASGDLAAARAAFGKAAGLAKAPESQVLFAGYLALADVVGGDASARQRLADLRERLSAVADDPWTVKQLHTAEAAFAPAPA